MSYLKQYLEKDPFLTEHFDKFDVQDIKVKINIMSNKANLNLGKVDFKNYNSYVESFKAEEISLDFLLTDLIRNKIRVNTLNILKADVTLVSDIINNLNDKNVIDVLSKPKILEMEKKLINNIILEEINFKLSNTSKTLNVKSNIKSGVLIMNEEKVILDNFIINDIEYKTLESEHNFFLSGILLSNLKDQDYLISIENFLYFSKNKILNELIIDSKNIKAENINIKFNLLKKSINLIAAIKQNSILLPIEFKGNIKPNLTLDGKIEGKLDNNNILNIIDEDNLLSLGFDISNIKNTKTSGTFQVFISNNKIRNADFELRSNLDEFKLFYYTTAENQKIEVALRSVNILGKYENSNLKILDFQAETKQGKVSLYGNIENIFSISEFNLVATLHSFSMYGLNKLYSLDKLIDNKHLDGIIIKEGTIENLVIEISNNKKQFIINSLQCELKNLHFRLQDSTEWQFDYLKANIDDRKITINIDKANISQNRKKLELNNNQFLVNFNGNNLFNSSFNYKGKINASYKDLKEMSKHFFPKEVENYFFESIDGNISANINLKANNIKTADYSLDYLVNGKLKNFYTLNNVNFKDNSFRLELFKGKFGIKKELIYIEGIGILNDSEAKLDLKIDKNNRLEAKVLSNAKFQSFDFLGQYNFIKQGSTNLEMLIVKEKISDENWNISFTSDLNNSAVLINQISHKKPISLRAKMKGNLYFKNLELIEIKKLNYATDDMLFNIDIDFSEKRKIKNIRLNQFIHKNNNFYGEINYISPEQTSIKIRGDSFNFKDKVFQSNNNERPILLIDVAINNLIYGKRNFGNTELKAKFKEKKIKNLSGVITFKDIKHTSFNLQNEQTEKNQNIEFVFNDFGLFLKNIGITDDFLEGKGKLILTIDKRSLEIKHGDYDIENFSVKNASFLARMLQLASFTGLLEILGNEGIPFNKLTGKFDKNSDIISSKDTRLEGVSLGGTVKGELNLESKNIKIQGILVPAYAINSIINKIPLIGEIVTGIEGEGIIGVEYKAEGNYENPNYSINPLSLLTPGILRNLFTPSGEKENKNLDSDN